MEKLRSEAQEMQSYLDITCSNNPEEVQERISTIMTYLSRSGEMLAQAKKILRARKSQEIQQTIIAVAKSAGLSASVQNALLESCCEEEAFLVDWIERLNRSCVHQIDGLRTILSYEKENLRLTKTGY